MEVSEIEMNMIASNKVIRPLEVFRISKRARSVLADGSEVHVDLDLKTGYLFSRRICPTHSVSTVVLKPDNSCYCATIHAHPSRTSWCFVELQVALTTFKNPAERTVWLLDFDGNRTACLGSIGARKILFARSSRDNLDVAWLVTRGSIKDYPVMIQAVRGDWTSTSPFLDSPPAERCRDPVGRKAPCVAMFPTQDDASMVCDFDHGICRVGTFFENGLAWQKEYASPDLLATQNLPNPNARLICDSRRVCFEYRISQASSIETRHHLAVWVFDAGIVRLLQVPRFSPETVRIRLDADRERHLRSHWQTPQSDRFSFWATTFAVEMGKRVLVLYELDESDFTVRLRQAFGPFDRDSSDNLRIYAAERDLGDGTVTRTLRVDAQNRQTFEFLFSEDSGGFRGLYRKCLTRVVRDAIQTPNLGQTAFNHITNIPTETRLDLWKTAALDHKVSWDWTGYMFVSKK